MAEINANIVVEPINLSVVEDTTNLGVTVEPTSLNLYTTVAVAAGAVGEIQYNDNGRIAGVPITTFDGNNLTLGDVSNVKIGGGTNTYFLQTDGAGTIGWAPGTVTANTGNGIANGAVNQIQMTDGTGNFISGPGFTFDNSSNVLNVPGNVYVADSVGIVGNISITGTTSIQQAKEKIVVEVSGANGTVNFDLLDSAIVLNIANATDNFTLNFRGNSNVALDSVMSNNESMTCSFIHPNGNTPYYANVIQVDGNVVTPKWNNIPGGSSLSDNFYTFNIIKTAPAVFSVYVTNQGYE